MKFFVRNNREDVSLLREPISGNFQPRSSATRLEKEKFCKNENTKNEILNRAFGSFTKAFLRCGYIVLSSEKPSIVLLPNIKQTITKNGSPVNNPLRPHQSSRDGEV